MCFTVGKNLKNICMNCKIIAESDRKWSRALSVFLMEFRGLIYVGDDVSGDEWSTEAGEAAKVSDMIWSLFAKTWLKSYNHLHRQTKVSPSKLLGDTAFYAVFSV